MDDQPAPTVCSVCERELRKGEPRYRFLDADYHPECWPKATAQRRAT